MRSAALAVVVCLAAIAGAGRAHADCPLPLTDAAASQSCANGATAYAAGNFATAASEFAAAYGREPDPGLLYAWAQAKRLGAACPEALELYRRYLETKPNEAQTTATRGWIEECEKAAGVHPPPPPPPPPDHPIVVNPPDHPVTGPIDPVRIDTPGPRQWYQNRLGLGLAIGGAVAFGVGTGFLIAAGRSEDRAHNAEFLDDHNAAIDEANSRRRLGLVGLGVGAALAVGSAVSFVMWSKHRDPDAIAVGVDGGGRVFVRGSF